MNLGIRGIITILANLVITSSVALVTSGLSSPIAANQRQKLKWWIPITVGATGGVRVQIVVPAAGVIFSAAIKLVNNIAPSITTAYQSGSAAFTNALANAGTHWLEVEADIENGVNAGTVDLQIAQNTSDVLSLTVLKGGSLESVIY
jgi:hypothetical protein